MQRGNKRKEHSKRKMPSEENQSYPRRISEKETYSNKHMQK